MYDSYGGPRGGSGGGGVSSLGGSGGSEMDPHNKCLGGRMWCVSDICGIICAVMTWLLVTYAEFVVFTVILGTANYPIYTTFNLLLFNVFALLALSSHARAMFTDPVSGFLFCLSFRIV